MYSEATRDTISLSVATRLQEGGDAFKINTSYMDWKQSSNTTVSRKECKYKFSIFRFYSVNFFFSFDRVLGDFADALHLIPFRPQASEFKVPLTGKTITPERSSCKR